MDFEPIAETNMVHKTSKSWSAHAELNYWARKIRIQTYNEVGKLVYKEKGKIYNAEIRISLDRNITLIENEQVLFTGTLEELAKREDGYAIQNFKKTLQMVIKQIDLLSKSQKISMTEALKRAGDKKCKTQ